MLCLDINNNLTNRDLHIKDSKIKDLDKRMKRHYLQEQRGTPISKDPLVFLCNSKLITAWVQDNFQTQASKLFSKTLTTLSQTADKRKFNSVTMIRKRTKLNSVKRKTHILKSFYSTSNMVNLISDKHTWRDLKKDSSSRREGSPMTK